MIPEWVVDEMQTVDLGDARRDARVRVVLADLAPQPSVSLPAAVGGGRAETDAVCEAEGSRVFRPELRGRVRGLGMEVGVPNHAAEAATANPARHGADGRPLGRLRKPLDRREARRRNNLERTSTIWKGLPRLHDMARGWDAFGPTPRG